jgi:hypothetical protein
MKRFRLQTVQLQGRGERRNYSETSKAREGECTQTYIGIISADDEGIDLGKRYRSAGRV